MSKIARSGGAVGCSMWAIAHPRILHITQLVSLDLHCFTLVTWPWTTLGFHASYATDCTGPFSKCKDCALFDPQISVYSIPSGSAEPDFLFYASAQIIIVLLRLV